MKKYLPIFLLLVAALPAATESPRVTRAVLTPMEKSLDGRISRLWEDNPLALMGPTRGVYLEGYGAVFTAEVNLVSAPLGLMAHTHTKEEKDRHRARKIERRPQLLKVLRTALMESAALLDTVPMEEQVVIVAFLSVYPWEDAKGLPGQVTLQAPRKKLLEVKRAGGTGLEAAIRVTEY